MLLCWVECVNDVPVRKFGESSAGKAFEVYTYKTRGAVKENCCATPKMCGCYFRTTRGVKCAEWDAQWPKCLQATLTISKRRFICLYILFSIYVCVAKSICLSCTLLYYVSVCCMFCRVKQIVALPVRARPPARQCTWKKDLIARPQLNMNAHARGATLYFTWRAPTTTTTRDM